ncbi:MAG: amidohydrolase family protein [Anaerolineaceae bacterium]|jgi:5-methylthioadenosine/S-adenosylhomocysteine deaminase|nr:amidohydrolase family protein [Anaerolineaceae bacterium]
MKQTADTIFINAIVLTMDKQLNQYEPGAVAVKDTKIVAVGPQENVTAAWDTGETVDCGQRVLLPGLINAHTHVPMTLLRGLADDLRLDVWLMGYCMPVEREFVSPDFVRLGTRLGCAEMIRSGITTFADMYYFEDDIAAATAEIGMRALLGESILMFPSPDSDSPYEALEYTRKFIEKWKDHPLITPVVSPHAAYTNTEETLQLAAKLALEYDVPLHTHIAETALEVENLRREKEMPVVPYVKKQNLLKPKAIAAHCVHIDEGEMYTLLHANTGVAHNPSSNLKLASGIAPIPKMVELGLNVGIGTDGTASNNDLDMFEEMRLAAFVGKVSTSDPTTLPADTILLMATRIGAQALHIADTTGSLEIGKQADLILVDINRLHNSPRFRRDKNGIYAQIVYAGKSSDVTDVMVAGKWLMRGQQLLTIDEKAILNEARLYAEKVDAFLTVREQSVLAKLIAIGGASEEESYEIQAKVAIENIEPILEALHKDGITISYKRHYKEYDNYLMFDDPQQGMIRFREDHFVNDAGEVTHVRSRLTHIGQTRERHFLQKAILNRSRYLAPANQSLRFYREYFTPTAEKEVNKIRLRFLITFENEEFYINLDTVLKPDLGHFLEVKTRTWSKRDADEKANLISKLVAFLGAAPEQTQVEDYVEML